VRRALAWTLTLPLAAAGVLVGHAAAYTLTGAPLGTVHSYLDHVPQIGVVLATAGLLGVVFQQRGGRGATWPYAVVGVIGFAAMEHLERVAHTGHVPWLLADRTFLVGLALQVPTAFVCAVVARALLRSATAARPSLPPRVSTLLLPVRSAAAAAVAVERTVAPCGRAPPPRL
jgi:hypothetical protein